MDVGGKEVEVDARPSDAIALAVRVNAPIFVAEQVMDQCGVDPKNISSASSAESENAEQKQADMTTGAGTEVTDETILKA